MAQSTPITERGNELSKNIDVAAPEEIVRIMRSCDGQLFAGFGEYPGLYDKQVVENLDMLTEMVAELVAFPKDSVVVVAGAGSSGRIAFMVARACNEVLRRHKLAPVFRHLIAGGDEALIRPKERAEDDADAALADLKTVLEGRPSQKKPYSRMLYIGVSCGLSATYVAAQLKYVLGLRHGAGALIGFNPPSQARTSKATGAKLSFADVVDTLEARIRDEDIKRFCIISPVVGPEAITGSTRMKGGTATKILLEIILGRALAKVLRLPFLGDLSGVARLFVESASSGHQRPPGKARLGWQKAANSPLVPADTALQAYEAAHRAAYLAGDKITELMKMMSSSWSNGGHVYYLGRPSLGLVGLLDASEQLPTFGCSSEALQAFITGQWESAASAGTGSASANATPAWAPAPSSGSVASSSSRSLAPAEERSTAPPSTSAAAAGDEAPRVSDALADLVAKARLQSEQAPLLADVEGTQPAEARQDPFSSLSVDHFLDHVLPTAERTDTVVLLESRVTGPPQEFPRRLVAGLLEHIATRGINLALVTVEVGPHDRLLYTGYTEEDELEEAGRGHGVEGGENGRFESSGGDVLTAESIFADVADVTIQVVLPAAAAAPLLPGGIDAFGEIAAKVVLNIASTGAQVLQGKVYGNRMIDLRISNEKLLARAASIVADLARVDQDQALGALYWVVWGPQKPEPGSFPPISETIAALSKLSKVIPTAILLCSGKYGWEEACSLALSAQSVRTLVEAHQ